MGNAAVRSAVHPLAHKRVVVLAAVRCGALVTYHLALHKPSRHGKSRHTSCTSNASLPPPLTAFWQFRRALQGVGAQHAGCGGPVVVVVLSL